MPSGTRPVPYSDVDIATVRAYVSQRVNAASLRQVAGLIGMRHTSLDKFVTGSEPYARNRIRLVEWWLREHQVRPVEGEMIVPEEMKRSLGGREDDPVVHLDALLEELRGEARTEARLRITTALAQAYARMGAGAPDWLYGR